VSGGLWLPGATGPVEEFVSRVHRAIERFAEAAGVERAWVEVELLDGARYTLDALEPEPGLGYVTLVPHREAHEEDLPERVIVPLGIVKRIELSRAEEQRARFGFVVPGG
jgi:hypothetical protein